ncbi:MAG TPA: TetR/AcrR family transcriptional regulator [Alphaproteobacteria bacterium]|nr:TetR/AcrR family transcriptional regulator [Alphaproteobacteria bacterium]
MNLPDRKSRKRRQTRDHISAVASALFERHGYEAVTMEQIAAEADVARGTLYNHFPVKEAVLAHGMHAQLAHELEPLMQQVMSHADFISRLTTLLDASASWWEAHRQYAAPYIRYRFQEVRQGQDERPSSEMITQYSHLIAEAQRNGEIRPEAPPARLAHYLHFLYLCAVMTWLKDDEISLRDEFSEALGFFLEGAARR